MSNIGGKVKHELRVEIHELEEARSERLKIHAL